VKKIQCVKCEQVFWTELLGIDESLIGSGEWIKCGCPRCRGEWAIVATAAIRPRVLRGKAKPAPKRRVRPQKAVEKEPVAFTPARIRSLRRRLGLSQGELAALIGVNRATANMWEKGKIKPKEDKMAPFKGLMKIAKEDVKKLLAEKMPRQAKEKNPKEQKGGRGSGNQRGQKAARKAGK
jgi:DNA-binding transcriptional regulator YiaG